jgi:hypothetical protein
MRSQDSTKTQHMTPAGQKPKGTVLDDLMQQQASADTTHNNTAIKTHTLVLDTIPRA